MNSEDESKIEGEIKRHNSEDEIDHGPVLKSLRQSRQNEIMAEEQAKQMLKDQKKKAKDTKDVQNMLDDVSLDDADKKQPQENSSVASSEVKSEAEAEAEAEEQ